LPKKKGTDLFDFIRVSRINSRHGQEVNSFLFVKKGCIYLVSLGCKELAVDTVRK